MAYKQHELNAPPHPSPLVKLQMRLDACLALAFALVVDAASGEVLTSSAPRGKVPLAEAPYSWLGQGQVAQSDVVEEQVDIIGSDLGDGVAEGKPKSAMFPGMTITFN